MQNKKIAKGWEGIQATRTDKEYKIYNFEDLAMYYSLLNRKADCLEEAAVKRTVS